MTVHNKLSCPEIKPGDEITEDMDSGRVPDGCARCGIAYRTGCEACANGNHTFGALNLTCSCCGAAR